ncbi:MAG: GatB/YqeY domain-containing protein [Desulfobulbia bacterium]
MKEKIQNRIKECMKEKNTFELNILKTVLGDIQTVEARGKDMSDEAIEKLFRKFKEGTEETVNAIGYTLDSPELEEYKNEIAIYDSFIPQTLSVEDILKALEGVEGIKEANSDGQATGAAMKHLKGSGAKVLGGDVSEAVKAIRNV